MPVLLDAPGPVVLESEGGEGVRGDGAHDEEQVEERQRQQHVVERVLPHLLAAKQREAGECLRKQVHCQNARSMLFLGQAKWDDIKILVYLLYQLVCM